MTRNPTSSRRLPAFFAGLTVLACALAALALPTAAVASKCGDQVLQDWADNGRIDEVYALHCYQDAIDDIPADLEDYTNAHEIISRALAARADGSDDPSSGSSGPGSGSGGSDEPDPRQPSGPVSGGSEVTPAVNTSDASSIPIPLLLLAGMSLLLLGAGGLGYLSRRRNAGADGLTDRPGDDNLPA